MSQHRQPFIVLAMESWRATERLSPCFITNLLRLLLPDGLNKRADYRDMPPSRQAQIKGIFIFFVATNTARLEKEKAIS